MEVPSHRLGTVAMPEYGRGGIWGQPHGGRVGMCLLRSAGVVAGVALRGVARSGVALVDEEGVVGAAGDEASRLFLSLALLGKARVGTAAGARGFCCFHPNGLG